MQNIFNLFNTSSTLDLRKEVQKAIRTTSNARKLTFDINELPYRVWQESVLYAIDMMDWRRSEKRLSRICVIQSFRIYLHTHHCLPTEYLLLNKRELKFFEMFLIDGIQLRVDVLQGKTKNSVLDNYQWDNSSIENYNAFFFGESSDEQS